MPNWMNDGLAGCFGDDDPPPVPLAPPHKPYLPYLPPGSVQPLPPSELWHPHPTSFSGDEDADAGAPPPVSLPSPHAPYLPYAPPGTVHALPPSEVVHSIHGSDFGAVHGPARRGGPLEEIHGVHLVLHELGAFEPDEGFFVLEDYGLALDPDDELLEY